MSTKGSEGQEAELEHAPPRAAERAERLLMRAHELSLHGLDTLPAQDLLLLVRPDERPLQGLAGLVDWRFLGGLTRILKKELFEGRAGESLLTISGRKLPVQRIFVYGLGRDEPVEVLPHALGVVGRAGGKDVALAPFGELSAYGEVAEVVARAAFDAGITHLTCLSEEVAAATKALVVVEAHHPWAVLESLGG